ncbi:uncharacterized protein LOC122260326 [Penaeus japonicus]|uniref:uncharacterized protein LOC122260326 n=1 Tax=Penaeus japonicus TaxID=27405 RepID=UPI001C711467|nr:uncharacterized protein LOC122260326 [Penaeus japonicus]
MGVLSATSVGAWAAVALLLMSVLQPPTTDAAAEPWRRCCRGGRFVAGALGFAGGYLLGHHHHHHHGGGCGGCGGGCGGCGGGCGWCGGGWYGRKRRSLDEVMNKEVLEDLYWKIAREDEEKCGLRLVCELAQKDPNDLAGDETLLLLPYRGRTENSAALPFFGRYDEAVRHGQEGRRCHQIYASCAFPHVELMARYRANLTGDDPYGFLFPEEALEEEEAVEK